MGNLLPDRLSAGAGIFKNTVMTIFRVGNGR